MRKLLLIVFVLSVSICFAGEIDVFKLADNGTLEQLESASKEGANFNVKPAFTILMITIERILKTGFLLMGKHLCTEPQLITIVKKA